MLNNKMYIVFISSFCPNYFRENLKMQTGWTIRVYRNSFFLIVRKWILNFFHCFWHVAFYMIIYTSVRIYSSQNIPTTLPVSLSLFFCCSLVFSVAVVVLALIVWPVSISSVIAFRVLLFLSEVAIPKSSHRFLSGRVVNDQTRKMARAPFFTLVTPSVA